MPEQRQNGGRLPIRRRISEHHDDGRDRIGEEAVHREQMRDPAAHAAEFAGGETLDDSGTKCERNNLAAADLPLRPFVRLAPVIEEVGRALLVGHVEERAERDERHHDDDERLQDGGRDRWPERGERIFGEHHIIRKKAGDHSRREGPYNRPWLPEWRQCCRNFRVVAVRFPCTFGARTDGSLLRSPYRLHDLLCRVGEVAAGDDGKAGLHCRTAPNPSK